MTSFSIGLNLLLSLFISVKFQHCFHFRHLFRITFFKAFSVLRFFVSQVDVSFLTGEHSVFTRSSEYQFLHCGQLGCSRRYPSITLQRTCDRNILWVADQVKIVYSVCNFLAKVRSLFLLVNIWPTFDQHSAKCLINVLKNKVTRSTTLFSEASGYQ